MKRDIVITVTIDTNDCDKEPDYSIKSKCNTPPTRAKVLSTLKVECEKTKGWDGMGMHPTRIWLLRRAFEYLK